MGSTGSDEERWAAVREASRIVAEQAECSLARALELMQDTADRTDGTLDEIASLVLSGEVRYD